MIDSTPTIEDPDGWQELKKWLKQMPLKRLETLVSLTGIQKHEKRSQSKGSKYRESLIRFFAQASADQSLNAFYALWSLEGKNPEVEKRDESYYDQFISGSGDSLRKN
jgi:hypothetical protein